MKGFIFLSRFWRGVPSLVGEKLIILMGVPNFLNIQVEPGQVI